jgi:hypothetical protein
MADTNEPISGWERSLMAGERVKERLRRAARAFDEIGLPYAVVGGNAVAEWVARVDEGAVRGTRDIEILIRRADLSTAKAALESTEFMCQEVPTGGVFIDSLTHRPKDAVQLHFAGEKTAAGFLAPNVDESERAAEFRVATLHAVVRFELIEWRTKHRMHVRDLIDVGLIDRTWPARFPPPLDARLQQLLDDPNG